ncbi:amidase signature enzyme [Imleria badia]|nr:amidase signature enzyme [Imleria badia]
MHSEIVLPDLYEVTISEIQGGLESGRFRSTHLVKAYLARIEEVNLKGAALHAVSEINATALRRAEDLDAERSEHGSRGPLHGIPILIKDNIVTAHELGMNTTAGSYALEGSVAPRDAFVISKLHEAGAIFIGKASMAEWACFRGEGVPDGFSARGGQTTSPYYPYLNPLSSSSGSAVASAIGIAAATLGSETTGSIVLPASRNNIVGIKPTVGLVSRSGGRAVILIWNKSCLACLPSVIPISPNQDTVGPLARCVADAALLLSVIVGNDPSDTCDIGLPPPQEWPDYTRALNAGALRGKRLGVPRALFQDYPIINDAFQKSLDIFRGLGAHVIDPVDFPSAHELKQSKAEDIVLTVDFKPALNKYLAELVEVPTGVRSLADVIKFNLAHADIELPAPYYTDQSQLLASEASQIDEKYYTALAENRELGRTRGIDAVLQAHQLDALILPTDSYATKPTGVSGYPIISVPLGHYPQNVEPTPLKPTPIHSCAPNMPFGIAFIGTAYSEYKLIGLAYAFEQATKARLQTRAYPLATPITQLRDVILQ